jgi:CBS domain-containing protein
MLVKDVMHKNVVVAKADVTIKEASKVMTQYKIGSLIVLKDDKIVGIMTESDIVKSVSKDLDLDSTVLEEVMSKKIVTIDPEKTIEDAVDLMVKNKIKKVPVVEQGKIKGIITASDIVVVEPKLIASIANLISLKLPGLRGG